MKDRTSHPWKVLALGVTASVIATYVVRLFDLTVALLWHVTWQAAAAVLSSELTSGVLSSLTAALVVVYAARAVVHARLGYNARRA